jgi:hypothetical protein
MQLINASVYDKEAHSRNRAIEQTRQQRILKRDYEERLKIRNHIRALSNATASAQPELEHLLDVGGLKFSVSCGGGKLMRLTS